MERLQAQLEAFRKQQQKANKTQGDIGKERERKRAERQAEAKPKPASLARKPTAPLPGAKPAAPRKAPLAKLVKDVLDCIYEADQPLTSEDIDTKLKAEGKSGFDYNDTELLNTLQNHERLEVVNAMWTYKAKHQVRNKNELFKLLMRYPEGILAKEVKDAYKGVEEDVKILQEEKQIFVIGNADDGTQDVIFPCDPKLRVEVDNDIQQLWKDAWVDPDHVDAELKKAGIKPSARKEKRVYDLTQKKERKKRKGGNRVSTNTHMLEPKPS